MNELISNKIINVPFKGDRNYVYASDLFMLIVDKIIELGILDLKSIDYSVHSLLKNKVTFSLYCLNDNEKIEKHADVRINFSSNKVKYVGLINENDLIITDRTIYNENEIYGNTTINEKDSSIELKRTYSEYSNLDVLTSMNKRLLTKVRSDIEGKWVSVRLQLEKLSYLLDDRKHYKVKLVKIFSNKYSRSDLYNENRKIGSLYFSII